MEDLQKSWSERLESEQMKKQQRIDELEREERQKAKIPYLWNLNEDLSLCAKVIHFLHAGKADKTTVQYSDNHLNGKYIRSLGQ